MRVTPQRVASLIVALVATASLVGCASGPEEPVGGGELGLSAPDTIALPGLRAEQWVSATAGCEGMLAGDEPFAFTIPDGLVVAMSDGVALCADTIGAVRAELGAMGLEGRAETLRIRYFVTLSGSHTLAAKGPAEGEPNPQPNIGARTDPTAHLTSPRVAAGPNGGEPNPQPNTSPDQGEPNPQPNIGADGSDSTSSTSSEPPPGTGPLGV